MTPRCVRFFHALSFLVAALALRSHSLDAADSPAEAAISQVLDREASAFQKGDLAGVAACWETEPTSSVFESGYANWGWADYRDNHLSKELAGMKVSEHHRTNLHLTLSGEMALALFDFHLKGVYEGRAFEIRGLETAVLRRKDGAWRILHVHTSAKPRKH